MIKALRAAWREFLREYKRQQRINHIKAEPDPWQY